MDTIFDKGLVSVIIPVYNSEKHISKTIESVLNQTYKSIEILLVNDCSNDNSEKIIKMFLQKNGNITYNRLNKNSGAAVARNRALELAKGRYIAFLDSDDLWYPQKVAMQLELMNKKNVAICYTAIEMIDENDSLIKGKRNVLEKVDYKFLLKNTMLATSSIIIDREIIGNFRMSLRRSGQDYATWLQLMRKGTVAYGINKTLVKYRKSSNSLSSNKFKSVKQVWDIQTKNERIHPIKATYNSFLFAFNAFKKHYLK